MTDKSTLPPVIVPEPFYELVRLYAFQHKLSISAAVRRLLKESPSINALAQKQGVDLSTFEVGAWGGNRRTNTVKK